MACAKAGLDVETASVPYIAGWAADDEQAIERDALLIDRLSARIERALEDASARQQSPQQCRERRAATDG